MLKFWQGKKESGTTSQEPNNWAQKLKSGLSKSSNKFNEGLKNVLVRKKLDQQSLGELEELLISSDMGAATAAEIVAELARDKFDKDVSPGEIKNTITQKLIQILSISAKPIEIKTENHPHILLVCGVNGSGKTTTIGKLAKQWQDEGRSVMVAACDTFRAAAIEQLEVWAKRSGCAFVKGELNADPASVAYQALEKAKAQGIDILIIDSAGRLQNKTNLMEELSKMVRTIKKIDNSAPHDTIIVLDATTGQNANSQVKIFKEAIDITGIILTKLDGTAKGGVLISLAKQFGLPIHAIGVGEAIEDLRPFNAREFAENLVG